MKAAKPNAKMTAQEKLDLILSEVRSRRDQEWSFLELFTETFGRDDDSTRLQRGRWATVDRLVDSIEKIALN